ncbi:hypothetical protein IUY40_07040 [Flavobacterium sp. ALJ2]|uniref:hypothetical protein n=1 Tax=Flavobacterium sp. ALJ2 TaxID=2786960 RepID=UPI00189EA15B|nr:hypothetical protein [Flavobacterium sp. ALJ2]MBF7091290.1 hypothetical protein [Flavobacterium sp. ALJ2]
MCDTGKEIKLCTCVPNGINSIVHNKKSRKFKKLRNEFTWTLKKYVGDSDFTMDGMIIFPLDALSEDLTNKKMLVALNSKNCFDFDYIPNEGDNLRIDTPHTNQKFLSFIYRKGEWVPDFYDGFRDKTEKINYGKVTFENSDI